MTTTTSETRLFARDVRSRYNKISTPSTDPCRPEGHHLDGGGGGAESKRQLCGRASLTGFGATIHYSHSPFDLSKGPLSQSGFTGVQRSSVCTQTLSAMPSARALEAPCRELRGK